MGNIPLLIYGYNMEKTSYIYTNRSIFAFK